MIYPAAMKQINRREFVTASGLIGAGLASQLLHQLGYKSRIRRGAGNASRHLGGPGGDAEGEKPARIRA